jgi:coenzyme F420-0:L-glutamate ligase / coenzyme F420-1:gamma-L-glutamate ligase
MKRVEVIGGEGLEEVSEGASVGELICAACSREGIALVNEDVVVVAHKIVSKAEGQILRLADIEPSARALELARQLDKDPALVEIILRQSRRIIRMGRNTIIVETHHGFICANAGVDLSNVGPGRAALLPKDPDGSAQRIREEIRAQAGVDPGVIISDSFGRPWRTGTVDVAVGISGLRAFKDERGTSDRYGYELRAAVAALADEIAAAAELAMGKKGNIPVVIVRGCEIEKEEGTVKELLRPEAEDLFRQF